MKRITIIILTISCLLAFPSCKDKNGKEDALDSVDDKMESLVNSDELLILTENYPPFNYEEDGELQGVFVDIIVEMLKISDLKLYKKDIKIWPWSRGYSTLQKRKNTVLFATAQTKERKVLFKWIGPVFLQTYNLIAKKTSNIQIEDIDDIKKYKIAAIRDDVGEGLLLSNSLDKINEIIRLNDAVPALKMIDKGRADLFSYAYKSALWYAKQAGLKTEDFKSAYVFQKKHLYYAFNKDTDEKIIRTFEKAFIEIKKVKPGQKYSKMQLILKKYF